MAGDTMNREKMHSKTWTSKGGYRFFANKYFVSSGSLVRKINRTRKREKHKWMNEHRKKLRRNVNHGENNNLLSNSVQKVIRLQCFELYQIRNNIRNLWSLHFSKNFVTNKSTSTACTHNTLTHVTLKTVLIWDVCVCLHTD